MRARCSIAVAALLAATAACTAGSRPEARTPSDERANYCRAVDAASEVLGDLATELERENGDPEGQAQNLSGGFAEQVDDRAADLPMQDLWASILVSETNTQLWRLHARRLERNPQDMSSLVALSHLVGHAQGACDAWRHFEEAPTS